MTFGFLREHHIVNEFRSGWQTTDEILRGLHQEICDGADTEVVVIYDEGLRVHAFFLVSETSLHGTHEGNEERWVFAADIGTSQDYSNGALLFLALIWAGGGLVARMIIWHGLAQYYRGIVALPLGNEPLSRMLRQYGFRPHPTESVYLTLTFAEIEKGIYSDSAWRPDDFANR